MENIMIADELLKLKELLDLGVLTQEEFNAQKEKLLSINSENTTTDEENVDTQIQTTCRINGYLVVNLSDALKALRDQPHNLMAVLINRTGLTKTEIEGLKEFIEREGRIPAKYRTGYTYEMTKTLEDNGGDRLSPLQTIAGINQSRYMICPNCNKRTGLRISTISRGVSVGIFGLASGKLGKTFECQSCGYRW